MFLRICFTLALAADLLLLFRKWRLRPVDRAGVR